MTNQKTTKRALLSSVVALLLCFSMLLGTTYAWFTDSLTVTRLEAQADVTVSGGTLVHAESDYPAVSVQGGGSLTLNEVTVISENYCNLITSGSLQAAEFVGIQVFGGTCVLNDWTIEVVIEDMRYANSAIGVGIHGGHLIMNGNAVTYQAVYDNVDFTDADVTVKVGLPGFVFLAMFRRNRFLISIEYSIDECTKLHLLENFAQCLFVGSFSFQFF